MNEMTTDERFVIPLTPHLEGYVVEAVEMPREPGTKIECVPRPLRFTAQRADFYGELFEHGWQKSRVYYWTPDAVDIGMDVRRHATSRFSLDLEHGGWVLAENVFWSQDKAVEHTLHCAEIVRRRVRLSGDAILALRAEQDRCTPEEVREKVQELEPWANNALVRLQVMKRAANELEADPRVDYERPSRRENGEEEAA